MATLKSSIQVQQYRAWQYYGFPVDKQVTYAGARVNAGSPIGEVRYVIGWISDQMSRMRWSVKIDGSDAWSLKLPDGEIVTSAPTEGGGDADDETSNATASKKVLDLIGWTPEVVRQVTTNLFVAGEFDYVASVDETETTDPTSPVVKWQVISVVDPDRNELLKDAVHKICGVWPHPADPSMPDAPLFGVLGILEEMDWLSRLSRSQMAHRMSLRGIVGAADGLSAAGGGDFWAEFQAASEAGMKDPTNVAPLMVRGAAELVEPVGSGMRGLSWLIPDFPADKRIDEQMQSLIQRLAYGLPIPPEILLGLQAQSRATAYQVEENSYRAHIEPPATLLVRVAQQALSLLIPNLDIEVDPDPTDLLARRHSTQDVKDAWDRGLVSAEFVREVLDIDETAAPSEEDLALLMMVSGKSTNPSATDPANVVAQAPPAVASVISPFALSPPVEGESGGSTASLLLGPDAIVAAVGGPTDAPLDETALRTLSGQLAEIDHSLMMELAGATQQATDRAREKVGARVRSSDDLRKTLAKDVPNSQVAAALGLQAMNDLGVPVADIVAEALVPLGQWWERRAAAAQMTVRNLLGPEAKVDLSPHDVQLSTDVLLDLTAAHVIDTFDSPEAQALTAENRSKVLTTLGGGR